MLDLSTETGLSVPEVSALKARFLKISPDAYMSYDGFRSTLGLLGAMEDQYICRRMFVAFDEDKDGRLSFPEFLRSLATMLRGSDEEKLDLSFRFFDRNDAGRMEFATFRSMLLSLRSIFRNLTGTVHGNSDTELLQIFNSISNGKPSVSLEAYKLACRTNDRFLAALGLRSEVRLSAGKQTAESDTPVLDEVAKLKAELLSMIGTKAPELQDDVDLLFSRLDERRASMRERQFDFQPSSRLAEDQEQISDSPRGYIKANTFVSAQGGPSSPGTPMLTAAAISRGRSRVILGPKHGKAIHFGHESWNMVLNMMIGVRLGVGRSQLEYNRAITSSDFHFKDKISILPSLTSILDSRLSQKITAMRFVDYAPLVFRSLRESSGITAERYLKSIGPEQLFGNLLLGNLSSLAELTSEGKSGAFFYFTADNEYLIKTVTAKEKTLLKAILPAYYQYISENPESMIVRFHGLHALREKRADNKRKIDKLYFVVMGNLFAGNGEIAAEVARRYDLKGSWVQRAAGEGTSTGKDTEFRKSADKIEVEDAVREKVLSQIQKDTEFLASRNILDYSLLVGVSDSVATQTEQRGLTTLVNMTRSKSFFLGLIDVLTEWDAKKKSERFVKSFYQDARGISCMPPLDYAQRFQKFMADEVFPPSNPAQP